jgi:hypothetical protein
MRGRERIKRRSTLAIRLEVAVASGSRTDGGLCACGQLRDVNAVTAVEQCVIDGLRIHHLSPEECWVATIPSPLPVPLQIFDGEQFSGAFRDRKRQSSFTALQPR